MVPLQQPDSAAGEEMMVMIDERLLMKLEENSAAEAIVTFDEVLPFSEKAELLKKAGIDGGVLLKSLPMAGVFVTKSELKSLSELTAVRSVYYNAPLAYDNNDATDLTGVDKTRVDNEYRSANGGLPVSGKGIGVVINDSGVDGTHKDHKLGENLIQNVTGQINLHGLSEFLPVQYAENVPSTDNSSGHGTHVAGIVGGTGAMSAGKYEGVAPGASLIGYGSGAAVAIIDTLGGFDYALTHQAQYGIRIITNSWGDTGDMGTPFDPENPVNVATKALYDRNILTVFSAGNSGPTADTITGNYKKAPWVVTVAAGDKAGRLADFSSRGKAGGRGTAFVSGNEWLWKDEPVLTAPGKDIVSTRTVSPVGVLSSAKDIQTIDTAYVPYYTTLSGTSMAAPHAAGVAALMLDANPYLSTQEIRQLLIDSATPMEGYSPFETGAGYINAYKAVGMALFGK
ncbi:peptidase S8 [Fictibacillus aquaticus]|uniref:Peptidase S8 n=2 Tax=Fictibacillus aquaticus TaxID=2021314 RepID=A0A235FEK4_9BACL|nr:peptidase S8 [Fictibacillus aquaticus]